MRAPTLRQVAKVAGVSVSTVSYALNGKGRIDPATRARVHAIASEMGYTANLSARSLRSGRSATIGLLLPEYQCFPQGDLLKFEWYARVCTAVTQASFRHEYAVLLIPNGDTPAALQQSSVDGYIVVDPSRTDRRLDNITTSNIPVVAIGHDPTHRFQHSVTLDVDSATENLLQLLRSNGLRRLLTLGVAAGSEWTDATILSVETWCRERHVPNTTRTLAQQPTTPEGLFDECYAVVSEHLRTADPPDAIFATALGCAAIALRAVTDQGLSVPNDVLIAQDGNEPTLLTTTPTITAVDHPAELLAATAVDRLTELIRHGTLESTATLVAAQLINRDSTERCGAASSLRQLDWAPIPADASDPQAASG